MLYENIVLCLEGKPREKKMIQEALRLKKALNSELTVFHVNDPDAGQPHLMMDSLPRIKREDLDQLIQNADCDNVLDFKSIQYIFEENKSYSDAIIDVSQKADLLIMGHNRHRRFIGAVINSTDEQVADSGSCPILLVPLG